MKYLTITDLAVLNANAASSPVSAGIPALTGLMGAVHAMERRLAPSPETPLFDGVGVVINSINVKAHLDRPYANAKALFCQPRIPKDRHGRSSPIIAGAFCDMNVSFVVALRDGACDLVDGDMIACTHKALQSIRVAGGSITSRPAISFWECDTDEDEYALLRSLRPGFVLLERPDLIQADMDTGMDALDSIIDRLAIHFQPEATVNSCVETMRGRRRDAGWIIPIATGYRAISEPFILADSRAAQEPSIYAESLITLGECVFPTTLDKINEMLWRPRMNQSLNYYHYTQTS